MTEQMITGPLRRVIVRHGEHEGQEGRPGEAGGSQPGFTHTGDGGEWELKENGYTTWYDGDKLAKIVSDNEDGTYDLEIVSGHDRNAYYDNIPADELSEPDEDEIKLWTEEGPDASVGRAIESFGLTENPNEGGYILEDGTMLDFSGSNQGAGSGRRYLDHRDIGRILLGDEPGGTEGMIYFMDQTSSIRMSMTSGDLNVDFAQTPTSSQKEAIEYLSAGVEAIYWDYTNWNPETKKYWRADSGSIDSPTPDDLSQLWRDLMTASFQEQSQAMRIAGLLCRVIARHYAPTHPGTGTDQGVHSGNGAGGYDPLTANTFIIKRMPPSIRMNYASQESFEAAYKGAIGMALNEFAKATGIEPRGIIFTNDLGVYADARDPKLKDSGQKRREVIEYLEARLDDRALAAITSGMGVETPAIWVDDDPKDGGIRLDLDWKMWRDSVYHETGHWVDLWARSEGVIDAEASIELRNIWPEDRYKVEMRPWYGDHPVIVKREYIADLFTMATIENRDGRKRNNWVRTDREMTENERDDMKKVLEITHAAAERVSGEAVERTAPEKMYLVLFPKAREAIPVEESVLGDLPKDAEILDPDYKSIPAEIKKSIDEFMVTLGALFGIERHGDHDGQEGRPGEVGGSKPGFTHEGDGERSLSKLPTREQTKGLPGSYDDVLDWAGGPAGFQDDGETYVVYHGTKHEFVNSIREEGLKPPEGMGTSVKWFMFTTDPAEAAHYANSPDGIVLEYRIPSNKMPEYLWPGQDVSGYKTGEVAKNHAVREAIPGDYLTEVYSKDKFVDGESKNTDLKPSAVERHSEGHIEQEGRPGEVGGSQPGYWHSGGGEKQGERKRRGRGRQREFRKGEIEGQRGGDFDERARKAALHAIRPLGLSLMRGGKILDSMEESRGELVDRSKKLAEMLRLYADTFPEHRDERARLLARADWIESRLDEAKAGDEEAYTGLVTNMPSLINSLENMGLPNWGDMYGGETRHPLIDLENALSIDEENYWGTMMYFSSTAKSFELEMERLWKESESARWEYDMLRSRDRIDDLINSPSGDEVRAIRDEFTLSSAEADVGRSQARIDYNRITKEIDVISVPLKELTDAVDAAINAGDLETGRRLQEEYWERNKEREKLYDQRIDASRRIEAATEEMRAVLIETIRPETAVEMTTHFRWHAWPSLVGVAAGPRLFEEMKAQVGDAESFIESVVAEDVKEDTGLAIVEDRDGDQRADYSRGMINAYTWDSVSTYVHEMGHYIDDDPSVHDTTVAWLLNQVEGAELKELSELQPGSQMDDEWAYDIGADRPYTYKAYQITETIRDDEGNIELERSPVHYSSEVVSMGLERLYRDPVEFMNGDPEHFDFILGLISGKYLQES